ncbi:hypothetical protein CDAR_93081 [Caerostris darwini]|uniref:Uncharacterized protein n=1 Tax=Caerostris darwini TaxID=1538125 RepID=A0AAV4WIL1_9ARAC|nr:hypothetical protein CDAR_93081 [Caerostris darwini]
MISISAFLFKISFIPIYRSLPNDSALQIPYLIAGMLRSRSFFLFAKRFLDDEEGEGWKGGRFWFRKWADDNCTRGFIPSNQAERNSRMAFGKSYAFRIFQFLWKVS